MCLRKNDRKLKHSIAIVFRHCIIFYSKYEKLVVNYRIKDVVNKTQFIIMKTRTQRSSWS